jgi:hypothetical protein
MYSIDIVAFPGVRISDFSSIGSVTVLPNIPGNDAFVHVSCKISPVY